MDLSAAWCETRSNYLDSGPVQIYPSVMSSPGAALTNAQYLSYLLKLGRVLQRNIALEIAVIPPSPPSTSMARVTISPVERTRYLSFAECRFAEEWREDLYSSTDKIAQLWVAFYHQVEERGERRIFGHRYTSHRTLHDKLRALYDDFSKGQSVYFFLSSLYSADELGSFTSHGSALVDALDHLRAVANNEGRVTYDLARRDLATAAPSTPQDVVDAITVNRAALRIWEVRLGMYRVERAPPSGNNEARKLLIKILKEALQPHTDTGLAIDANDHLQLHPDEFKDTFVCSVSVSELLKRMQDVSIETVASSAIEYYCDLSAAGWYAMWRRTAALVPVLGNVPSSGFLRFLHDYVGPDVAVRFAAVGSGDPQKGVKDLSYSGFEVTLDNTAAVSLAISAAALRDVGRLGTEDNVIKPPLMTSMETLCAIKGQSEHLTVVTHAPEHVKKGRVHNDATIA